MTNLSSHDSLTPKVPTKTLNKKTSQSIRSKMSGKRLHTSLTLLHRYRQVSGDLAAHPGALGLQKELERIATELRSHTWLVVADEDDVEVAGELRLTAPVSISKLVPTQNEQQNLNLLIFSHSLTPDPISH